MLPTLSLPIKVGFAILLHSATATFSVSTPYQNTTKCERELSAFYPRRFVKNVTEPTNYCAKGLDDDVATRIEAWYDDAHVWGFQVYFPHNITMLVGSPTTYWNTSALQHANINIRRDDTIRLVAAGAAPNNDGIRGISIEFASGQQLHAGNMTSTIVPIDGLPEYEGLVGINGHYGVNGIDQINLFLLAPAANKTATVSKVRARAIRHKL